MQICKEIKKCKKQKKIQKMNLKFGRRYRSSYHYCHPGGIILICYHAKSGGFSLKIGRVIEILGIILHFPCSRVASTDQLVYCTYLVYQLMVTDVLIDYKAM